MGLFYWKWLAIIVFNFTLFMFGATIWSIKNNGFFKALSLPGNYGEEVSKLSKLREGQNSHYIEVGNHQINFAELDWDVSIVRNALRESVGEDLAMSKNLAVVEEPLRKYLLGMVVERKLLYHQVHSDASFSVEDPKRYSGCIEEWQQLESVPHHQNLASNVMRYLKSSLCERSLLQQYIKEKIAEKIVIDEQELFEYYNKNKSRFFYPEKVIVRHILLSDEPTANKVRVLANSHNFQELAAKYSIAPEGVRGGLLGPFVRGQVVPVFDRAFAMRIGEMSPIVRSDYGYHILMLQERIPKGHADYEKVKKQIKKEIYAQKIETEYQSWINDALAKLPIGSAKIIW